jgi:hypothetical protein
MNICGLQNKKSTVEQGYSEYAYNEITFTAKGFSIPAVFKKNIINLLNNIIMNNINS